MGLYLCIFDQCGEELCGVEVGLYRYFQELRDTVARFTPKGPIARLVRPGGGKLSSKMPTLLVHSDCDGAWSVKECRALKQELEEIKQVFLQEPVSPETVALKQDVFKFYGVTPQNLFECFIDSDCEFLIDRLIDLCDRAIEAKRPIVFQ